MTVYVKRVRKCSLLGKYSVVGDFVWLRCGQLGLIILTYVPVSPLCRSTITKRKFVEQAMSSSSTLSVSSSALSETNDPVVPIFALPKATLSSLHLALNTIEEMHERFA